ncbi:MAG: Rieske 2Fe-2S domain-containing protein [Acidobacteria bacterium]|nr:Rieske 2Fe-2S domain-containing protein [Acidobacteriota bacterium]
MGFRTRRSRRREPQTSDDLRLASYPHPYPDGWYRLMTSKSLRRGQIRYFECLGRALVVWRSEDSDDVHAMQAFCPHLGANLRHGRVREDRIECPFHNWQFTGDGRAACVPYSDSVPTRVATESFPVQDVHGQIFMYHRSDGAKQQAGDEVPYPVPRLPEIDDGRFVFRGHYDAGRVHMHIIEFVENAVDFAHFMYIHERMNVPWTQIPVPGVAIEHIPGVEFPEDRPWTMHFLDEAVLKFRGRPLERTRTRARATFTGAASIVNFRFFIPDTGEIDLCQTHLPISPLEQQVDFHWFADRRVPRLLAWYVVGNWISQWRHDIQIWENKTYLDHPTLCRDDGPVVRMRRWYRQFFPDPQPPGKPPGMPRREPSERAEGRLVGAASN